MESIWTTKRLRRLIDDKVEEDLHLEYKGADALLTSEGKKNELSKDISAFANADGGVVIYGMSETDHLPTNIDPVSRESIS